MRGGGRVAVALGGRVMDADGPVAQAFGGRVLDVGGRVAQALGGRGPAAAGDSGVPTSGLILS